MSSLLSAERPYPGLRPYGLKDADWFYGRDDQSLALYRLLDRGRLVAVVGGSGSGKSSVVRAGLMPLLHEETVGLGGRRWASWSLHPGEAPIARLAEALAGRDNPRIDDTQRALQSAERERIEFQLRKSSFGLVDVLRARALADGPAETPLIVIDQFEELFRFSDLPGSRSARAGRREEAAAFVQLLLQAVRTPDLPVRVVLTMRSDYLGDCARFQGLPEAVTESEFLVPSLTRKQREQAICGPAEKAGGTVSGELLQCLLDDSNEEFDQLPVLQHALMRTWAQAAQRGSRQLLRSDYNAIGGMAGAISQHADALLDDPLLNGCGLAAEQVFRALAELDRQGRGIRRPLQLQQLVDESGLPRDQVLAVVERFRADDCSFLVPAPAEARALHDADVVDVAHEALIRRWSKISRDDNGSRLGWLFDEASDGRIFVALLATAEGAEPGHKATLPLDQTDSRRAWWQRRPRSIAWGRRYGGDVATVLRLLDDSRDALVASEAATARSRRNGRLAIGALAFAIAAGLLLTVAWSRMDAAEKNNRLAQSQIELEREKSRLARSEAELDKERAEQAARVATFAAQKAAQEAEVAKLAQKLATAQAESATAGSLKATRQRMEAEGREKLASQLRADAEQARKEANESSLQAWTSLLHNRSVSELSTNIERGLLLSLAAMRVAPSAQAKDALLRGLQRAQRLEVVLGRHGNTVRSVVISPDGRLLASAGDDQRIILWDLERRRPQGPAEGFRMNGVRVLAVSPDGRTLAAGDALGAVSLWTLGGQRLLEPVRLPGPGTDDEAELSADRRADKSAVTGLAFQRDGKLLAVASRDGSVRIWNLELKQVADTLPSLRRGAEFSVAAAASRPGTGPDDPARAGSDTGGIDAQVAFSPDGTLLAYGSERAGIRLWQVQQRQSIHGRLQAQAIKVSSLAFSPDSKLLAVGTHDRKLLLWNPATHLLEDTLPALHQAELTDVAFSPDGKTLASASTDKRLQLWNVADRAAIGEPLMVNQAWPLSLAFRPDGKTLASGNSDNSVVLWDLTEHRALSAELRGHKGSVMALAFSPNSQTLASGGADKTIRLWDTATQTARTVLNGHTELVIGVAFSPDGQQLASVSFDKQARLWDLATLKSGPPLTGAADRLQALAFSPDGRQLLTGGTELQMTLWDLATGTATTPPLPALGGELRSLAFSPRGDFFASAGYDNRVVLWDPLRRKPLDRAELPHADKLVSIAISPDGKTIASGGYDKQVTLWDVASRQRIGEPLQGHQDQVWAVAFSPDGKLLASGGRDKRVLLWDVASRVQMGEALGRHTSPVRALAFSPDGRLLASGGFDERVVLWNASAAAWERRACEIANRQLTEEEWRNVVGTALPFKPVCQELSPGRTAASR